MCQIQLTPQDFKSDQEVRWCPGCGDHAILNAIQRTLPELGYNKEDYAIISGIGCSSRFPYYMNTYGFHSIHGRASAIASGTKAANPNLSVWQITGDGDSMAIGGNHFIHAIRRNIDINIIIFNNEIYGLTKGQYSPTTKFGSVTKTSPYGTIEHPFKPGDLVIGAQGKFFARSIDGNIKLSTKIFKEAAQHDGTSVVEVYQNCVIYSDKVHEEIIGREHRDERTIVLEHGKPMVFGANSDKGLVLDGLKLKVVTLGEDGYDESKILVHDAHEENPGLHMMLANMTIPEFPVAFGVIRSVKSATYDDQMEEQIIAVKEKSPIKNMDDLLNSGSTWDIE